MDAQGGQKHDKSTLTIEADKPAVSDAELDAQSQLKLRTRRHYSLQADDYVTLLLRAARCAEASSGGGAVVVGPTVAVGPLGVATGADTTGVAQAVPPTCNPHRHAMGGRGVTIVERPVEAQR